MPVPLAVLQVWVGFVSVDYEVGEGPGGCGVAEKGALLAVERVAELEIAIRLIGPQLFSHVQHGFEIRVRQNIIHTCRFQFVPQTGLDAPGFFGRKLLIRHNPLMYSIYAICAGMSTGVWIFYFLGLTELPSRIFRTFAASTFWV